MPMLFRTRKELWASLLSEQRIFGRPIARGEYDRSEFQRDYDRIVFSPAFRRLQDKTQVFPLSSSDYTRNRLTHSLEVSSVGRTLGVLAGKHLLNLGIPCEPAEIGTIVATAALAHDIGNPPFGHSGEAAIQSWAKRNLPNPATARPRATTARPINFHRKPAEPLAMTSEELADFYAFEGNAQGFRTLVRTAARTRTGGLRPTLATLGAVAKYPRPSLMAIQKKPSSISQKKHGYFQNDRAMACKAFEAIGMIKVAEGVFSRHPLAFLTEAADDACYTIADIEDAFKLGILDFDEVSEVVLPIASRDPYFADNTYLDKPSRFSRMRASALAVLVRECIEAFSSSLEEMEKGTLEVPLLRRTRVAEEHSRIRSLAKEKVYRNERVLQIEYAGFSTIGGLLDMFYAALCDPKDLAKDEKLRRLLPLNLVWRPKKGSVLTRSVDDLFEFYLGLMTPYERLLAVTDYVSGMTDGFAVQLYQRLSGIRLPD